MVILKCGIYVTFKKSCVTKWVSYLILSAEYIFQTDVDKGGV